MPLAPTEEMLADAREALPELPAERRERYLSELGLPGEAGHAAGVRRRAGRATSRRPSPPATAPTPGAVANWVTGELVAKLRDAGEDDADPVSSKVSPAALAALVGMVEGEGVSSTAARQVLATLVAEGGDPAEIVEREGLGQIEDSGELEAIVARALEAEPEAAEKVRDGDMKAIGPIVGYVMRETKGRADGGEVDPADPREARALGT